MRTWFVLFDQAELDEKIIHNGLSYNYKLTQPKLFYLTREIFARLIAIKYILPVVKAASGISGKVLSYQNLSPCL